jgi:hypothetical protein
MIYSDSTIGYPCVWFECADVKGELVLVYSKEKTKDPKETFILFNDKYIQKLTASGNKCSGKIGNYVKEAIPGTYNQDGTLKPNCTI